MSNKPRPIPLPNFDFTSLYPGVQKVHNIRSLIRKDRIRKIFR